MQFVDYTMGANSGYICFEEPESALKARAAAVFVKDGGFTVKNSIAFLEAVNGRWQHLILQIWCLCLVKFACAI